MRSLSGTGHWVGNYVMILIDPHATYWSQSGSTVLETPSSIEEAGSYRRDIWPRESCISPKASSSGNVANSSRVSYFLRVFPVRCKIEVCPSRLKIIAALAQWTELAGWRSRNPGGQLWKPTALRNCPILRTNLPPSPALPVDLRRSSTMNILQASSDPRLCPICCGCLREQLEKRRLIERPLGRGPH